MPAPALSWSPTEIPLRAETRERDGDGDRDGPPGQRCRDRPAHDRGPRRAPALHAAHAQRRVAGDDAVPPGQGPRLVLRRLRPGGGVRRRDVRDGGAGPPVHPPPPPLRPPPPPRAS